MEHFVTLFNSMFLPQGLALHRSMERHIPKYTLWILCVDDVAYEVLHTLALPNVRLLELAKLETTDLLRVKKDRTIAEYCWTLTPFAPRFVFDADSSIAQVTYIDADVWFRKNPAPIFCEFKESRKHVLITDHAYAPEYDQSATSGQYCVQFMTFTREGEVVRKCWEERCMEWCYARIEDGKFGDQKYLDEWPSKFTDAVHVLQNKELLLAPWNAIRFPYGNSVCWHFHSLRMTKQILSSPAFYYGSFKLPKNVRLNIYYTYLKDLRNAITTIENLNIVVKSQIQLNFLKLIILSINISYMQLRDFIRKVKYRYFKSI